ncbi:hypothetical protein K438DRAFT_1932638 [Mycena galopus ATCC 62051]|nr:hypothetical protein K438DRAFT_1932638 [Mycena galopus ATCC 62051]
MANTQRLRQGLPLMPPKCLYDPSRVRRDALYRHLPCGNMTMAMELRLVGPDSPLTSDTFLGYVGTTATIGKTGSFYNVLFQGYGGTGSNAGVLWNIEDEGQYSAITVAGKGIHTFCAAVNQYNQDLLSSQNLQWLEPPGAVACELSTILLVAPQLTECVDDIFPLPWYSTASGIFWWYPQGASPTYSGKGNYPWVQTYLKWSCVNPPLSYSMRTWTSVSHRLEIDRNGSRA